MTVLVSMPVYRTPPELMDKAIRSILDQTFTDLVLVVVGDGEEAPISPGTGDDRLLSFTLPENRGRYFADAVAQAACPFDWWSPHDADDWSGPNRFADLWRRRATGAVWSAVNTAGKVYTLPNALGPLRPRLHQTGYHIGLYSIDRIRAVGGYHPGYRVGYDTMFNALIRMTGEVAMSPKPMYYRARWPGSLTQSSRTGRNSALRNQAVFDLRRLYSKIFPVYESGRTDLLAGMITDNIPAALRDEVAHQAELLHKRLA